MSSHRQRILTLMCGLLISIHIGCTGKEGTLQIQLDERASEKISTTIQSAAVPPSPPAKANGLEFDGNAVVRTNAIYEGEGPVLIEAIAVANSSKGEQSIVSNCQVSGFSLSIKDGQWTFYWHDGIKYKSVAAPATLGKKTHLLGIVENGRMELRLDGVSQGMTAAGGHRESKLPFYVGADPKLDADYKYDPQASEFPFTGIIYECRISNDSRDVEQAKRGDVGPKSNRAFLHYVFDAVSETVIDRSAHKNDATMENGKWLSVPNE